MQDVWIVIAVRTPFGRLLGALASVRPHALAALVVAEAMSRAQEKPATRQATTKRSEGR